MTVPELALTLRTRGRASVPLEVAPVRELVESDLALLASGREVKAPALVRLRDRHHSIARMVAQGLPNGEISAISGMCISRISILKSDPTFRELVSHYQSVNEGATAEFVERATVVGLTALANLQEMLEDDASALPPSMQLEIAKFAADRTGHAPVTKVQNTNINVDLGTRMANARSRLEKARIIASLDEDDADA